MPDAAPTVTVPTAGGGAPLAELAVVRRSGLIESRHFGSLVALDPSGSPLLELGDPKIEWVQVARGLGLPAVRCETAEQFETAFARAMSEPGPKFIEAAI